MYGILHKALFSWVSTLEGGEDMLLTVLKNVNYDGDESDFYSHYSEEVAMEFLREIASVTGYRSDDVLFEAGKMTMKTFSDCGYDPILQILGNDLYTILGNLNGLHFSFLGSFPLMKIPHISPEKGPDGSLHIHYRSQRQGLAPFMMGAIVGCAKVLLGTDIELIHRVKPKTTMGEHVFVAFMDAHLAFPPEMISEVAAEETMSNITLDADATADILPWHFAINRDLQIVSLGRHLAARTKQDAVGSPVEKLFRIITPLEAKWDFDEMCKHEGAPYLFATSKSKMLTALEYNSLVEEMIAKSQQSAYLSDDIADAQTAESLLFADQDDANGDCLSAATSNATSKATSARGSQAQIDLRMRRLNDNESIKLHGELIYDADQDVLIFAGSPHLKSLEELESQGIALHDIPIHSHGREVLYQGMFQAISAKQSTEVNAKLAELDHFAEDVVNKKAVIDNLLQSILPKKVAESLSRGAIPEPEEYKSVSILYSDIAGFTSISSDVPSIEVMTLLHEMFVKFDDLADKHGCYKVETIGDAYVVVAGCPDECDDHAERIAAMAIDMVKVAQSTRSPLDGEPIRIRIGMHSGPVRAGVVGRDRPRYCLFGDTVSVASLMESNGIPCCIQVSYRFLRELPAQNPFLLAPRGFVKIKGKGKMKTFLLLGYLDSKEEYLFPDREKFPELASNVMVFAYDGRLRKRIMGHIPQLIGRPLESVRDRYRRNTNLGTEHHMPPAQVNVV